jgi:hypothetical protein
MLLEHGLPQAAVVKVMRRVRARLGAARAQTLKKDLGTLFDQQAISSQAKPGMIAVDNTSPIFLAFHRLTDSSVGDPRGGGAVEVCRGHEGLGIFLKKHSKPGTGVTFFEFVGLIHSLAANLLQVRPVKRGRGAG